MVASSPFRVRHAPRPAEDGRARRAARPGAAQHPGAGAPDRGGGLPPPAGPEAPTRCSPLDLADAADVVADELAADRMAIAAQPALLAVGQATGDGRAHRRALRRGGAGPDPLGRRRPAAAHRAWTSSSPPTRCRRRHDDRRPTRAERGSCTSTSTSSSRRSRCCAVPSWPAGRWSSAVAATRPSAAWWRPRRTTPASTASGSGMPLRIAARQDPRRGVPAGRQAGVRRGLGRGDGRRCAALEWGGVPVVVEVLGWDEAFLAAGRGARRARRPARVRRAGPRRRCSRRPGCTAAVGIGDNKLRAKIATDFGKPRGRRSGSATARRRVVRRDGRPADRRRCGGSARKTAQTPGRARDRHRAPARRLRRPGAGRASSGRRWGRGTTGSAAAWTPARSTPRRGCRGRTAARRPTRPTSRTGTAIAEEVRALTRRVVDDIDREGRPAARVGIKVRLPPVHHRQPQPDAAGADQRPRRAGRRRGLAARPGRARPPGAAARRTPGDGRARGRTGPADPQSPSND